MDRLLEVREFDVITGNPTYKNDDRYVYLAEERFQKLITYIREYCETSEQPDISTFMNITRRKGVGYVITVRNQVGVIQLEDGFQIQILPKIDFGMEQDTKYKHTKKVFLRMLRSMKEFEGNVFNNSNLSVDRMNLYEIFINMYLQQVRKLLKTGLKSGYIPQEDNLKYFKGKLKLNEQLRKNLAHQERFYVAYDEFQQNRPENRLIKSTLQKLQKSTRSNQNAREISQLLTFFEVVNPSTNYEKDFASISIDRSMQDYKVLMQWSRVFLMNQSFTTFSGNNMASALLFPMERVYESYVARQLKRVFEPDGWEVTTQAHSQYLFEIPQKQFALRPDIMIRKQDRTVLLDTKWKRLNSNPGVNYGISQADMYQMYAYSKKYAAEEVWLLYPLCDEVRNCEQITFDSGDETRVSIHFVDIADIEQNLRKLLGMITHS